MKINKYSAASNTGIYLYTKGGEYSLDGLDYIGEYHMEGSTAKTGPVMNSNSRVLHRAYRNRDHYTYDKNFEFKVRVLDYVEPVPYLYRPAEQAYTAGMDARFFVEKYDDNTSYAIEINSQQYEKIGKKGGIDGGLYRYATIQWQLTGRREDIISHNELEVYKASSILPTIEYSIKNYLDFARITLV
jgi:hypothetical protein